MEALAVLFRSSMYAFVASWLFGLVESVGIQSFVPWAYRIGLRALAFDEEVECPPALGNIIIMGETENLAYKVIGDEQCLFRQKYKLFGRYNPLGLKGTVYWRGGKLTTSGRYSFGGTACVLVWLVGWTTAGIQEIIKGDPSGIPALAFGWIFGGGMFVYWGWKGLKRFKDDAVELKSALMEMPPASDQLKNRMP